MDALITEDAADISQEANQQTLSTLRASQLVNLAVDGHLWGILQPCSSPLQDLDLVIYPLPRFCVI
jgi:hypothetical protein